MAAPTDVATGEPITSTKMNEVFDRMSSAATYTPTISNWNSGTTAPTTTGRYWRTGDIVHVLVQSKLGTGTITVGSVTVSLPVAADTTGMILDSTLLSGTVSFVDVSAGASSHFGGVVRIVDANTVRPLRPSSATPGNYLAVTSSQPFTWATADEISFFFSYPIA